MTRGSRAWLLSALTVLLVGCDPILTPVVTTVTQRNLHGPTLPAGSALVYGLQAPFGIAAEADSIWTTEYELGNLVRIDPSANRIIARIHIGPHASHLVIQGGSAWVVDDLGGALVSVDTRTNQVVTNIPMRPTSLLRPIAVAAGEGSVWAILAPNTEYRSNSLNQPNPANPPSQLVRVDPADSQVLATISLPGNATGVSVGGGSVWVVSTLEPVTIYRIDTKTNRVAATIDTGHTASGALAYHEPYLWVANQDGDLTRIDSRTNRATSFEVGSPEWPALVAEGPAVWISAPLDNILARFDPATGTVSKTVTAGSRPQGFAVLGNDLWVANYVDGTVAKLPID